jgi:hypothetical protein
MQNKSKLSDFVFQGSDPRAYMKVASKLLLAGFLGVATGWVLQPFFATVFHLPYYWAYWPAVLCGFIVNLRSQVRMKNLNLKKQEEMY